jgi:DNA helicase-2/ATP-dependent DNA helicase PcrA
VPRGEAFGFAEGKGGELYAAYQKRLKELNAADFGDLLLEVLRLFQDNPDILADYQRPLPLHPGRRVPGYQRGPIPVAAAVGRRLAQLSAASATTTSRSTAGAARRSTTSCASKRTSRCDSHPPGAQLPLQGAYPGRRLGLIAHNQGRLGKTLFTDDDMGRPVAVAGVWDDEEEARGVGEDIEALRKGGQRLEGIAILVRASFQMRAFEDRFVTLGVPYRVIGGPRFYERQEIKDAIAYLEVTLNPDNDLKFERIINVPKRGLGDTSLRRVSELARARGVSLHQAAREITETEELGGQAPQGAVRPSSSHSSAGAARSMP